MIYVKCAAQTFKLRSGKRRNLKLYAFLGKKKGVAKGLNRWSRSIRLVINTFEKLCTFQIIIDKRKWEKVQADAAIQHTITQDEATEVPGAGMDFCWLEKLELKSRS